jgi:hypothetical protein
VDLGEEFVAPDDAKKRSVDLFFGVTRMAVRDSLFADLVCGFGHFDSHGHFLFASKGSKEFRVVALGLWGRVVRSWHVANVPAVESRLSERDYGSSETSNELAKCFTGQLTGLAWFGFG